MMSRILRALTGLGLIGYGIYSGNPWFYLGAIPLFTAIINWCPIESKVGGCDASSGCCSSTNSNNSSSCFDNSTPTWSSTPIKNNKLER